MYVKKHAYVLNNEKAASPCDSCFGDNKRAKQLERLLAVSVTESLKE